MTRAAVIAALCLLVAGCDQMARQPRGQVYGASELFANGAAMQAPPAGTVARGDEAWNEALAQRPPMTAALIQRGRERYGIYCQPCHDPAGYGQGIVPARGFPHPPSFHREPLLSAPSRLFVDVMTNGYGVMYSYADRIAPSDRWAIAAYIRALQLSQAAPAGELSPSDLARVEAADGR